MHETRGGPGMDNGSDADHAAVDEPLAKSCESMRPRNRRTGCALVFFEQIDMRARVTAERV